MVMNRNFGNYNGFNGNPYFNPQQPQIQPTNVLKMIAVTNKDEANATPVEFNGVPMFFFNQNTNEIYLKQFDITTGGKLETFRKVDIIEEEKKEKENLTNPDIQLLNEKMDNIKTMIENLNIPSVSIENFDKGGKNVK